MLAHAILVVIHVFIDPWYLTIFPFTQSTDRGDRTSIITAAKIQTRFYRSPCNFHTGFHGSPQDFKQIFTAVNGCHRHLIYHTEKLYSLEIQIF